MSAVVAYIGLGSNLDTPVNHVELAIEQIGQIAGAVLTQRSRLYRTAPWGVLDQPDFINAVCEVETTLDARLLLDELLSIERAHGRVRDGSQWGPRTLDLDLLLFGGQRIEEPGLCVPHPRIAARAFVLAPLAELSPGLHIPGQGRIDALLAALADESCRVI